MSSLITAEEVFELGALPSDVWPMAHAQRATHVDGERPYPWVEKGSK